MSPQHAQGGVVGAVVRHRWLTIAATLLLCALAVARLDALRLDAFPDLTGVQVQVLTTAPGMAAEEVEALVTLPVERAVSGVAGVAELRSISRPGVSSVAVVFQEGVDLWRARQMVGEQVAVARGSIPPEAGSPELAPPTTGLGEVVQLTIASDDLPPRELSRVFQRDVAPRLRTVDGVVEVNAWGGGLPQVDVLVDPYALVARGLGWHEVEAALRDATGVVSGGDVSVGQERVGVRATINPADASALEDLVVRADARGVVRLGDVARIEEAGGLTVGLASADAGGEAMFAVVQLLAGADALAVSREVKARLGDLAEALPPGVRVELVYDRDKLVGSTLHTVSRSLVEGGVLVIAVLLLLLGDLRAGLLVASVIPMAMLGAFTGLSALGMSGNLMSLGAVDFGLVVDGTIVVVESIVALGLARSGPGDGEVVSAVAAVRRPVLFAVGVLMVVYVPVLMMVGTEGKLFRPMAVTVLLALATALALSFTWVPAVASVLLRPGHHADTALIAWVRRPYQRAVAAAMRRPERALGASLVLMALTVVVASRLGVVFVPRLEEGDLVVQTARLPSISAEEALREATRVEAVLRRFPEVERVATRTGSPALATDPMGLEESDVLVRLRPRDTWTTAPDTEGLTSAMAAALAADAPGAAVGFTQPIEMRFNELLEGITSDVGVVLFGDDLDALVRFGGEVAAALSAVPGAADVRAPAVEGLPGVDVDVDLGAAATLGVPGQEVLGMIAGLRRGVEVGALRRGQLSDPVVLKVALPDDVDLVDLPVVGEAGAVTLGDVAAVREVTRPAMVRREAGQRRVVVSANVRGRDVGGFVREARARVAALPRPPGTWIQWRGSYEQLAAAAARTAVTVPTALGLIVVLLYYALGSWRAAGLIFLNVPAAASGGVVALALRGLPLSMSAIVGFIALSGVAVMNGIVLVSRTVELVQGADAATAAARSASERLRPVLMTALVAGIGFLPMALATGVGAEVQRPLATVVIGGLCTATPVTLLVLPGVFAWWWRGKPGRAPGTTATDGGAAS